MEIRVASRYARALFQVAKKQGIVDAVSEDLNGMVATMKLDPKFKGFLSNPSQSRESKLSLLETVFSDRVTALTMHLVRLLLQKRREGEIEGISFVFNELRRNDEQILYADVMSAQPLDEKQRTAILTRLGEQAGRKIEADFGVDSSLIGGVRVAIGNYVLDGSVKGSLDRLKGKLLYDLLKQTN